MGTYLALTLNSSHVFIWALCIGFNVAMIISFLLKKTVGGLITSIMDKNAESEASALTLKELGYENNKIVKFFLKDNSSLHGTVSLVGERLNIVTNDKGKKQIDFDSARFYISQEHADKASSLKKGNIKWYLIPIFTVISIIIAYVVILLLPYITF